jgi:hypothetical protein
MIDPNMSGRLETWQTAIVVGGRGLERIDRYNGCEVIQIHAELQNERVYDHKDTVLVS